MGGVGGAIGSLLGGGGGGGNHAQGVAFVNPLEAGQQQAAYDTLTGALSGQQKLAQALGETGGIQNQQSVFGQQQQLATALQNQAAGNGPNPAQAALAQSTAANTANQAALMAGQRGSSANAGLIARQAAQQGGANQQMAVGQGATLQAQQQLAAQNALMNQQAQMQDVAQHQIGNQMGATNAYAGAAQNNENGVLGAIGQYNATNAGMQANINNNNQSAASQQAQMQAGAMGGLGNALGGGLQSMMMAGPAAGGGMAMAGGADAGVMAAAPLLLAASGGEVPDPHMMKMHQLWHGGNYAKGGKVDVMVSPGEKYIPPQEAKAVAKGDKSIAQAGEKIPGKAAVKGDDLKNDTVHKKLDAGGIVIPRSVMDSEDPVKEGTKFLTDALKKHGGKKEKSDFHAALKKAASARG